MGNVEEVIYKERLIKIPIYDYKINIVYTENVSKYLDYADLVDYNDGCYSAVVFDCSELTHLKYNCLVVFDNVSFRGSVISHEAFHITCLICNYVGIKLTDSSEEAYAYLIGYLYKILVTILLQLKQECNVAD